MNKANVNGIKGLKQKNDDRILTFTRSTANGNHQVGLFAKIKVLRISNLNRKKDQKYKTNS